MYKRQELILCNLELPDGTAMELFHTLRRVAGMFQMKNPPVRLLPFFILTENNDLEMCIRDRNNRGRKVSKCFCIRPCALPIVVALEVYFVKLSLSEKSRSFFLFN